MLEYNLKKDAENNQTFLETNLTGKLLLSIPQLNKGTAFTEQERHEFNLIGKLPLRVETLDEQAMRVYLQYKSFDTLLQKNIYLNNLHNSNEVLFYKLTHDHLAEMLPVIYTPIVGSAVLEFNKLFRYPRGIYISFEDQDRMLEILGNRSNPEVDLIVVSDGEGVLGIGDQGVGAMNIPIAKLMVYTLAAGINPLKTLPILLDVGTNNQLLLDDPLYLGWRHERVTGEAYDTFIDKFMSALQTTLPSAFLHWEDFGRKNARRNLDRYRNRVSTFNDDIQGTGVVTLAALLAAVRASGTDLTAQRIIIFGAGTAGVGIADQICDAMQRQGLSKEEAQSCFWLLDRSGLLTEQSHTISPEQSCYARKMSELAAWETKTPGFISLEDVVTNAHPTILIGCSTLKGAFTESIVKTMASHIERPIIFPLSNPTEKSEAEPQDLINWTAGKALIATGSPFPPAHYEGKTIPIAQCNNALVYPGIGLGVIASKAKLVTDEMLRAACEKTVNCSPILHDPNEALLPQLDQAKQLSREIAIAVAEQAQKEGVSGLEEGSSIAECVDQITWYPHYFPYRKKN